MSLLPRPIATGIIVLVTIVWAANFSAQFVVPWYHPDVAVHGIFMAVVGGALALTRKGDAPKPGPAETPSTPEPPEPPEPPGAPDEPGRHRTTGGGG